MEQNIKETESVLYSEVFDEYSICCAEDEQSILLLKYCPWCGTKLPESKREEWFDKLEELGFDDPIFDDNIPTAFKTSEWRR